MRKVMAGLASTALAIGLVSATVSVAGPAAALDNGVAATPPMGWNNWNTFGCNISEKLIKEMADTIVSNGHAGRRLPVRRRRRLLVRPATRRGGQPAGAIRTEFPSGMKALGDYIHSKGLKFGIYQVPGERTCAQTCGGYPGATGSLGHEAQDAATFAAWGVDYLKYDWCSPAAPGRAGRAVHPHARRAARHRPADRLQHQPQHIHEEKTGATYNWGEVANLWRTTEDIGPRWDNGDGWPLGVAKHRRRQQSAGGLGQAGRPNDPDMLEVGNGGLTDTEGKPLRLWAVMAAPLIIGTDLRTATPETLAIYLNKDVIAVDQDTLGAQGRPVSDDGTSHVLAKPLANGDMAVALFNAGDSPAVISTTAGAIGLDKAPAYTLNDLWARSTTESAGTIAANVPAHGTVMYRVTPTHKPAAAAPNTVSTLTGASTSVYPGQSVGLTQTFTNHGRLPVTGVKLSLPAPKGWTVEATSPTKFGAVPTGASVKTTWKATLVSPGASSTSTLTGTTNYNWGGKVPASVQAQKTISIASPLSITTSSNWIDPGLSATATETYTNHGDAAVSDVKLALKGPGGWTAEATSPVNFDTVASGASVRATFKVTPAAPEAPIVTGTLTGTASYVFGTTPVSIQTKQTVRTGAQVRAPYRTTASTEANFGQLGDKLAIAAAGGDVSGAPTSTVRSTCPAPRQQPLPRSSTSTPSR